MLVTSPSVHAAISADKYNLHYCDPAKTLDTYLIGDEVKCNQVKWKREKTHKIAVIPPQDRRKMIYAHICTKYKSKGSKQLDFLADHPPKTEPQKQLVPDIAECIQWRETMKADVDYEVTCNGKRVSGTEDKRTQTMYMYANEMGGLAPQFKTINDVGSILNKETHVRNTCVATVENAVMMMSNVMVDTATNKISSGYESGEFDCKKTIGGGSGKKYYQCRGNKYRYLLDYDKAKKLFGSCTGFDNGIIFNDAKVYETKNGGLGYVKFEQLNLQFDEYVKCTDRIKNCAKANFHSEAQVYCTSTGYVLVNLGEKMSEPLKMDSDDVVDTIVSEIPELRSIIAQVKSIEQATNEKAEMAEQYMAANECIRNRRDTIALKSASRTDPTTVLQHYLREDDKFAVANGEALQSLWCTPVVAKLYESLKLPIQIAKEKYGRNDVYAKSPIFFIEEFKEGNYNEKFYAQLYTDGMYLRRGVEDVFPLATTSLPKQTFEISGNKFVTFNEAGELMEKSNIVPTKLTLEAQQFHVYSETVDLDTIYDQMEGSLASKDYGGVEQLARATRETMAQLQRRDAITAEYFNKFFENYPDDPSDNNKIYELKDFLDLSYMFKLGMFLAGFVLFVGVLLGIGYIVDQYYKSKNKSYKTHKLLKTIMKNLKKMKEKNLLLKLIYTKVD